MSVQINTSFLFRPEHRQRSQNNTSFQFQTQRRKRSLCLGSVSALPLVRLILIICQFFFPKKTCVKKEIKRTSRQRNNFGFRANGPNCLKNKTDEKPEKNLDQLSSLMLVAQGCRFSTLRIKLRIPCLNPVKSPSHYHLDVVFHFSEVLPRNLSCSKLFVYSVIVA